MCRAAATQGVVVKEKKEIPLRFELKRKRTSGIGVQLLLR
jgi:hypothetical protein